VLACISFLPPVYLPLVSVRLTLGFAESRRKAGIT